MRGRHSAGQDRDSFPPPSSSFAVFELVLEYPMIDGMAEKAEKDLRRIRFPKQLRLLLPSLKIHRANRLLRKQGKEKRDEKALLI